MNLGDALAEINRLRAQPAPGTLPEDLKTAMLMDSQWAAGAKFGWNCGVSGAEKRFSDAIEGRIRDRVEALAAYRTPGE